MPFVIVYLTIRRFAEIIIIGKQQSMAEVQASGILRCGCAAGSRLPQWPLNLCGSVTDLHKGHGITEVLRGESITRRGRVSVMSGI